MPNDVSCSVAGMKHAGMEEADLCALFAEQVRAAGREDIASLAIEASSNRLAAAKAYDARGELVAELGFSISDQELSPTAWQIFARDFARHISLQQ
ncbi:hypothetical protein [Qipengyuania vesicularis]|uniref:hypothetical protein n=1 Tax=Qipengyuania vesicularis TaxID=2867232 RepID=UPI001C872745|nr:hypothetical protein [Qipengyuania vesicularis]MBX7526041.1 hypothetical protein [Qipengyuania vesicularis]